MHVNLNRVPSDLLTLLVAIEYSIRECRSYKHLQNVRQTWLRRLDREYGSSKSKTCQSLIRETWDLWNNRVQEVTSEYRHRITNQQRFN